MKRHPESTRALIKMVGSVLAGKTTETTILLFSPPRQSTRNHRYLEPLCYERASPNYLPRLDRPYDVNPTGIRYNFGTDDANETTPPLAASSTSLKAPLTLPEYKVEVAP